MKACGFEKWINPYLDGELSGAKLRAFEEHLQACPRCREEIEQARAMLEGLRGMEEPEVPPMLRERLHAALSNEIAKGDGRVKRKVNPWVLAPVVSAAVVVCIVGGVLLSGNIASSNKSLQNTPLSLQSRAGNIAAPEASQGDAAVAPNFAMPAATAAGTMAPVPAPTAGPASLTSGAQADNGAEGAGTASYGPEQTASPGNPQTGGKMLIYTAYVVEETRDFDSCMSQVNGLIGKYNGYLSQSQVNGVPEGGDPSQGRTATITLNIPVDKYDSAMSDLLAMGHLLSKTENKQDVSGQYVDTKARRDTLDDEIATLQELLKDKAITMDNVIQLQNQITDLISQEEEMTAQLNLWDNEVSYSTITVELHEIVIPAGIAPANPTSLGDRAGGAFYTTLSDMKKGLEDFAVWFVGFLPWLSIIAVLAGVAAAIVVPAARKRRKAARKQESQDKKKEE